jgi:predicted phage terminase large subunit-like protein
MAHKRDGCQPVERELVRILGQYLVPHPKRDGYIYTPTGAELHIWTLGNKATAMRAGRGENYGTIVIDEAAWCTDLYNSFLASIRPSLADHLGYAVFASTPRGQKNDFFRIWRGLADRRFNGSMAQCNPLPNIQQDYKELKDAVRKGRLNPKYFRQEYDAEFVDLGDVLVSADMIQRDKAVKFPDDMWEMHIGMDLAFSEKEEADYCALVAVARNRSTRDYYVAGAYRFKEAQPRRMLEELKKFNARFHASKIAIESIQAQSALVNMWIDDSGLPIIKVKPDKDKITRFQPTAQFYADGRMWHDDSLPVYFEDELTLFPIAEHDDMVDALAYGVMSFGGYWDEKDQSGRQWIGYGESEQRDDGGAEFEY